MSKLLSCLLFCVLVVGVHSTTRIINWTYGNVPATKRAVKGDTVLFKWTSGTLHNVYEFHSKTAFQNCNFSFATLKCGSGHTSCSIAASAVGTRYFGCREPGHCTAGGMKVAVKVTAT